LFGLNSLKRFSKIWPTTILHSDSIERKNNDGNYEPATADGQFNPNKTEISVVRGLNVDIVRKIRALAKDSHRLCEIARMLNVPYTSVKNVVLGLYLEGCLTWPSSTSSCLICMSSASAATRIRSHRWARTLAIGQLYPSNWDKYQPPRLRAEPS